MVVEEPCIEFGLLFKDVHGPTAGFEQHGLVGSVHPEGADIDAQLKGEIAEADAKAHAATSEGPIIVDEEGVAKVPDEEGFAETPGDNAPKPKPDSNPADPEPKITKGGRKVAHAKPKD